MNARDGLDVAESRPGFTYEYAGGQLAGMTTSDGERTEITVAGGRVTEVRLVGTPDVVHTFSYQGKSDGLYHTRYFPAVGGERRFAFDESRRLVELLLVGSGDRTQIAWSGVRPVQRIEPDGSVRTWTWIDDDVQAETEPSGNVIQYTYAPTAANREDPNRRPLLQALDSLGLLELRTYDAAGRLSSRANGAGETTSFTYDADGNLASRTDPDGVMTSYSDYGEHGHASVVTIDGFDLESEWDEVGNLVRGTGGSGPEVGGVVARSYDADRNLRSLQLKTGVIEIEVRADGQQTAIARDEGDDHEMIYDAFGRLIERREFADGSWHSTVFTHDAMGRETAVERPNGMRRETVYDDDGRPVLVRALRDGAVEGTQTLTWQGGLLVSSDDTMGGRLEQFAYDAGGRTSAVTHGDGSFTVFGHDLRSRRTSEVHVEADFQVVADVTRAYDGAGREVEVREGGSVLVERRYEEGRIAEIRYGNGLTREFDYQPDIGGLDSASTRDAGGDVVESTVLTRIGFGLDFVGATTQTFGGVEVATEEAYYLAPSPGPNAAGPQLAGIGSIGNYFLDAKSNLLESPRGPLAYNAEGNRLVHAEGVGSYQYDEAGFVTERGGIPITWTAHGRLASHGLDELAWDMTGRLVSSTVAGVTLQRRFGGAVQADAYGLPVSMDLGDVRIDLITGQHQYRHFDFRGNVKFTTDHAGVVRSHYEYDGYGVAAVHGASDDPIRFVGRAEFGDLMILGERIYDPAAGRFLSPDPIFQLVNQFSYTLGNPVWFSDPEGTNPDRSAERAAAVLTAFSFGFGALGWGLGLYGALLVASTLSGVSIAFFSAAVIAGMAGAFCSPQSITRVPAGWKSVATLLPLQLLLAILIARSRSRQRPKGSESQ